MSDLLERASELTQLPGVQPVAIALASFLAAYLVEAVVSRGILALTRRTKTELDDRIVDAMRRPIFISVILFGLSLVTYELSLGLQPTAITISILETIAVIVWAGTAFQVSFELLRALSSRADDRGILQPRTLPIFDIVTKGAVFSGAIYFFFLSWDIDVTAWLASAGIVGIAVGFAAKDSLANLFAGIFIIADAPYKLGDYIVLDGDLNGQALRGEVTRIGMRSSRILTRDDLEITIPNSVIANSKIINESGGPSPQQRSRVSVGVAYGSDIDRVSQVLLSCAEGVENVAPSPKPQTRFRGFGDSSLDFDLLFWTDRPRMRGLTKSRLHERIYKALEAEGVAIPFPQRDVWLRNSDTGSAPQ